MIFQILGKLKAGEQLTDIDYGELSAYTKYQHKKRRLSWSIYQDVFSEFCVKLVVYTGEWSSIYWKRQLNQTYTKAVREHIRFRKRNTITPFLQKTQTTKPARTA